MPGLILYVDDDPDACVMAARVLGSAGYQVVTETDAAAAIELAIHGEFDAVLTDVRLGALDGIAVCEQVLSARPTLPVIVVTGHASVETAVSALRAGAYDFVTKPFDADLLLATLRRATQSARLQEEVRRLRTSAATSSSVGTMIGDSAPMRKVFDSIARIAATNASVLVIGESGTGKELIAREIHAQSDRADGPLVALNCAAVPGPLLESELFGHLRGAFTDAKSARRGLFLDAQGGTLFLDEIGEIPLEMQAKLLRALQERTVRAVGSSHEVAFDARLITATARDLEADVTAKTFRLDLYYRINVCCIEVPPLREREGDVSILARRFLAEFATRHDKEVTDIAPAAMSQLVSYRWPGNVRELENCIERAVTMTRGNVIEAVDLPARVRSFRSEAPPPPAWLPDGIDGLESLAEREQQYIQHVLGLVDGNKSKAARVLGVDRRTLHRKLARLEEASEGQSSRPAPPRLALVDSDTDSRYLLERVLSRRGFEVFGVGSVAEARTVDEVDAYVVAGASADGDPRELLHSNGSPVLLVANDPSAFHAAGFEVILAKPALAEDIATALRDLLEGSPRELS